LHEIAFCKNANENSVEMSQDKIDLKFLLWSWNAVYIRSKHFC
jgi:hypothetical protein